MVKFGVYTFPRALTVTDEEAWSISEKIIPGRRAGYRRAIGGQGARFRFDGYLNPRDSIAKDDIAALADGVARTLDLELSSLAALEKIFRYQTGPTWTDNTAEARSAGGTPFTLLGATSDYHYFGHRERFNQLWFDLQTLGSYGARTWEYSKGDGTFGTLSIDTDGTSGFSQDGTVAFTPPSDWKIDTVNSVTSKHWVRVKVASVTTAATVNQILANLVWNCIMSAPAFTYPVDDPYTMAYELEFVQAEPV